LEGNEVQARLKSKATDIMEESNLSEMLELMGAEEDDEAASTAMKGIMAQHMSECAMEAMREAKKRRMRVGAAAIILAADM
jgi:hypothetical protein